MKKIAIYNPYLETRGGGEKVSLALASVLSNQPNTKVYLVTHKKIDIKPLGQYFNLDLSKLKLQIINTDTLLDKILARLPLPGGFKNIYNDTRIYRSIKRRHYDLFINNCFQSNLPNPCSAGVYMCMFPQKIHNQIKDRGLIYLIYSSIIRAVYRVILHPSKAHAVYTYQLITANSAFTQKYIKEYWGLDSEILYPICEDMSDGKELKSKKILNVARFFEKGSNHHKRHDLLVDAFSQMKNLHKDGWELHIAGSVSENVDTLKYILSLTKQSSGLPVFYHFNSSFQEIKKLYNEASIYWHATGYGSDPNDHPERQEHFGIATVESMSAGAIPVVINTAGQKEIINDSENGFLWDTKEELIRITEKVSKLDSQYLTSLRKQGKTTSDSYNAEAFSNRVKIIFGSITY